MANIASRPRKRSLAKAKPASVQKKTVPSAIAADTIVEFTIARPIRWTSSKTGCVNRFVVTIGTTRPVRSSALRNALMCCSRDVSSLPNGIRSSAWK
jgi:hypothetical protein